MNRKAMRIVFIGLVTVVVGFAVTSLLVIERQRASDDRAAHALFESLVQMQRRIATENEALNARFAQIDLGRYMAPAMLISADAMRDAHAELARYRALLAERDALMRDEQAKAHALLQALPDGRTRELALRGAAATAASSQKVRDQVSHSQAADADAMQALFDWADAHRAIVELRNGTLIVHGQQPLADLTALDTRLRETHQAVDAAVEAARLAAQQSNQGLANARRLYGE